MKNLRKVKPFTPEISCCYVYTETQEAYVSYLREDGSLFSLRRSVARIINSMLKQIRMARFVKLVDKENKLIGYKDPLMVGFYDDEPDENKFVSKQECLDKFRVYSRDKMKKKYIAKKTCEAALKAGFLNASQNSSLTLLRVDPDKGEDFIEGLGVIGVMRELHRKDRDLIVFTFSVITFIVGLYLGVKL